MGSMRQGFFERVSARRDATALAIRDALVRHVRAYGAQPSTARMTLLHEVHETWRPVLSRAPGGEPLHRDDLAVYRELARSRALHSFPFADFRAGFEVAHTAGLRACLAVAEPGESVQPVAFTAWGVRELPRVLDAVTESYLDVHRCRGNATAARALLLDALLAGRAPGPESDAGHLVVVFRPRERGAAVAAGTTAAVERLLGERSGLLWRGGPATGELLATVAVESTVQRAREVARELAVDLAGAWRSRLHAAEAFGASPAEVPAALREARRTLRLVTALPDARDCPYREDDLLVELAVARQPDVRLRLTRLLEPLDRGPDLRRTLESLLACGLDRQRTAAALHLHRRSLAYRLGRIKELTGLDPATPHGIQVLRAAVCAARLDALPE